MSRSNGNGSANGTEKTGLVVAFINQHVTDARGAHVTRQVASQTAAEEARRRPELGDVRFYTAPKIERDGRWSATIGFGNSPPQTLNGRG
jgi:hypothetical protein